MLSNGVRFLSLFFAALTLGPALAHLLELPAKIGMPIEQYFVVQQIYRGWAWLGVVVYAALGFTAAAAAAVRAQQRAFRLTLGALGCLVAAQILFWTFTFPANRATANWTVVPPDVERLRAQWEWSHAAGAVLTTIAVALLIVALLPARLERRAALDPRWRDATPLSRVGSAS